MDIGVSLSPTKSRFAPILFAGNLSEGLRVASALGYSGVELSLRDSSKINPHSLVKQISQYNLKVYAIATGQTYITDGWSFYSREKDKRERTIERFREHIKLAAKLDCMVIIGGIRGTMIYSDESEKKDLEEQGRCAIEKCLEYAEKYNVTLLLEPINRYETNVVNTLKQGIEMIRLLGSSRIRLLADTFHMNIEEKSIAEAIMHASEQIAYFHFADSNRLAPGWGHIDFPAIVAALKTISFSGSVGIEVLPGEDDYTTAKQAISYLKPVLG